MNYQTIQEKLELIKQAQSFDVTELNSHGYEVREYDGTGGLVARIDTDSNQIYYFVENVEHSDCDALGIDMVELKELKEFCEMLFKE
jgi:hypothetical protein